MTTLPLAASRTAMTRKAFVEGWDSYLTNPDRLEAPYAPGTDCRQAWDQGNQMCCAGEAFPAEALSPQRPALPRLTMERARNRFFHFITIGNGLSPFAWAETRKLPSWLRKDA